MEVVYYARSKRPMQNNIRVIETAVMIVNEVVKSWVLCQNAGEPCDVLLMMLAAAFTSKLGWIL